MRVARWIAVCFVAVSLVGCSDSGGPDSEPPAPLTKAEMIARVDKLCAEGRGSVEGLKSPNSLEESAKFLGRILPVVRENLADIRSLGQVPAEDRDVYLEWLQAREGIVQTTEKMIEAAEAKDVKEFQRLAAEQANLDKRADRAADRYGFKVCGQSN